MNARSMVPVLLVLAIVCGMAFCSVGATARPKDVLIVAVGAEPTILDPHNTRSSIAENVTLYIYDNLVSTTNSTLEVTPSLATSWVTSSDGLTWTFKLRNDVVFQDGTPFNAAAVKVNFDRLLDPDASTVKSGVFVFVDNVKVLDDYSVAFTLKFPFGAFLKHLAHPGGAIISPAALEKYGAEIGHHPVGTGPFMLKEWNVGSSVVLERNELYYGVSPAFREIVFKTVREDAVRVMMLETGEADIAINVPPTAIDRLKDNPELKTLSTLTNRSMYIGMITTLEPVTDVRVRQALNYAVDKQAIVDQILSGYGAVGDSMLSPMTWGYVPGKRYEYNPARAKQLLQEAGVAPGTKLRMATTSGRYMKDVEIAEAVQGYLMAIGFDVTLDVLEWGTYLGVFFGPPEAIDYQLAIGGFSPSTGDADWVLRITLLSSSMPPAGYNVYRYSNPEFDEVVLRAQKTVDPKERLALYAWAQADLREDAPLLFLTTLEYVVMTRADLEGVVLSPLEYLFAWNASNK